MRIREQTEISAASVEEWRRGVLEAIAELEEQHREEVMSDHAYLLKKRALVKML